MILPARAGLALACIMLAAPTAWAQGKRPITGEGTEGFRALLASRKLQPLVDPEDLKRDPAHTLLVCFRGAVPPNGGSYPDQIGSLSFDIKSEFVDRGGALFYASDQSTQSLQDNWHNRFGFRIVGAILRAQEKEKCYRFDPECPLVERRRGRFPDLFKPTAKTNGGPPSPLLVATNRPSLLLQSTDLESIAGYSSPCTLHYPAEVSPLRPGDHIPDYFAQAKRYDGGGRILVLADHSVFINSMLLPPHFPNDNLTFAFNCLDWLMLGPGEEKRQYVMFMEDGRIWGKDDYNLMLQTMPANPEQLLELLRDHPELLWQNRDLAEELMARAEREGMLAEMERGNPEDPDRHPPIMSALQDVLERGLSRYGIVRFVLILGTLALLAYIIVAFIRGKFTRPKKVARLSVALDRVKPRAGLLDMRLRGGVGRGQYHELARDRAREMFAALDLTPADGTQPPHFTIDASWWRRGRIEQQLRETWSVAFDAEPVPVSARQWERWPARLDDLQAMIRRGVIRFEEIT